MFPWFECVHRDIEALFVVYRKVLDERILTSSLPNFSSRHKISSYTGILVVCSRKTIAVYRHKCSVFFTGKKG